ncbi:helix-turn-helix domain-containing protein [Kribbella deserti]|uniref:Helix-turn-helix domain-containing protein n=1 Tax=Kribbella deserti TaxID=1926257 RepID=A0ABV6QKP1_9ACTN
MSVGEELTAARVRAGLTIEELSAATRIRPGLLTAMEADDFVRCGGNFYARGHIRSIAKVLNTDPAPLIESFNAQQAEPEVDRSRREERADAKPPTVHPARPRWAVVLGAILVGLLGWGMVRLFTLPNDVEANASKNTPGPAVVTKVIPKKPVTKPTVRKTATKPVAPKTVRVTLTGMGEGSYVSLRNIKKGRLFDGILRSGSTQSMTYGGAIRVDIALPKNVRVYVNGRLVNPKVPRYLVTLTGKIEARP